MMMIIMIIIFIMNRVNVFVNPHCTSLHKHLLICPPPPPPAQAFYVFTL